MYRMFVPTTGTHHHRKPEVQLVPMNLNIFFLLFFHSGIINANRNSLEGWSKQLLHVWAFNASVADHVARTYSQMPLALTKNTVVLVTIATTDLDRSAIFCKIDSC
jgi:hypothetical protein